MDGGDEGAIADRVFSRLRNDSGIVPVSAGNACLKCGRCEARCTQRLPNADRLEEMAGWSLRYSYSEEAIRSRIEGLFRQTERRIGITPAGDWVDVFLAFVQRHLPAYWGRLVLLDVNASGDGRTQRGIPVMRPERVADAEIGIIVIAHYRLQDRIYAELAGRYDIPVKRLYQKNDIMWFGW
jgi:hypothetical protein